MVVWYVRKYQKDFSLRDEAGVRYLEKNSLWIVRKRQKTRDLSLELVEFFTYYKDIQYVLFLSSIGKLLETIPWAIIDRL